MSKTHTRKSNVTQMATGHFSDAPAEESQALVGMEPSSPSQVTGATVFDVIPTLSSVGQITALRAIANGAIIAAVFAAHDALVYRDPDNVNADEDRAEKAALRMAQQAELYTYAFNELGTLAQNQFDSAMTLPQAIDFACTTAAERKPDELPEEVIQALGLTAEAVRLIDAQEQQKAVQRSTRLRESVREHAEGIAAEVRSFLGTESGAIVDLLTAEQHAGLLRKVTQKAQARMGQLIGSRSRYSGALGEAMLLSADINALDKATVAFVRANVGELRDAA